MNFANPGSKDRTRMTQMTRIIADFFNHRGTRSVYTGIQGVNQVTKRTQCHREPVIKRNTIYHEELIYRDKLSNSQA